MSERERGAITAELVMALPAVTLVVAIAIGAISVQLKRIDLVASSSVLARAIARDEPADVIDQMISRLGNAVKFELQESGSFVCVSLKESVSLPGIEGQLLELDEKQCARATGR